MATVIGEVLTDRPAPSDFTAFDALQESITAAVPNKCSGIATRKGKIAAQLIAVITPDEENTIRQLILAHDFNQRTPGQQRVAQAKTDFAEMVGAKAAAAITQIDTDIAAIAGADNAALKQILGRSLQRQRAIIKAFARFVDMT